MPPTTRRLARLSWSALLAVTLSHPVAAADHSGHVTFRGAPVPGAIVTVTQGDQRVVTSTDATGGYHVSALADGACTVRVEMFGFITLTRDVAVRQNETAAEWALALKPFAELKGAVTIAVPGAASPLSASQPTPPVSSQPPTAASTSTGDPVSDRLGGTGAATAFNAADGLLVNGSVNNGAASPFSQLAAFGNNRRSTRSLYNGGLGIVVGNSAWDSRPFSFGPQLTGSPAYNDVQLAATLGGPVHIPHVRNRPVVFLSYQRMQDHDASTAVGRVPTLAERAGDFSQSVDATGQPIVPIDPLTGSAFAGARLPSARLSREAQALLNYYPLPNIDGASGDNYQAPVLTATDRHTLQARATQTLGRRDALFGNASYQQTTTDAETLFGFQDHARTAETVGAINWSRRISQFFSIRTRYQFTRSTAATIPYFANRTNVSGDAGILGNAQDPANWGPPSLVFSSGLAGLGDSSYARGVTRSDASSLEISRSIGRHNLAIGSGISKRRVNVDSQQEPRGTFSFAGAFTGSDLADFLLGVPTTTSIAAGNASKRFRGSSANAYVNDDWRVSPSLTINVGLRWEYESPLTEAAGRIANLDVSSDFSAAVPVISGTGTSPLSGGTLPISLVRPDIRGIQPRTALAWRPIPGSSFVLRAGYGIYRDTGLYDAVATLLSAQPPFSTTRRAANSLISPLTIANAFTSSSSALTNTIAIDPDLRVGSAHNWQVSAQRDLPGSLTAIATYAGTRGVHLPQELLPNTYPVGATSPCPTCPAGFIYLTSNGTSLRNAMDLELRRRLRNGLTSTLHYTLAKATDNASAFVPVAATNDGAASSGNGLAGASIAQDWRHLDAEHSRSTFDRRHLMTADVQYTTGMGITGGAFASGWRGRLLRGWTITSQLTFGSGLPLTPASLAPVPGTGVTGTIRPALSGASVTPPRGYYLNPAAYTVPALGEWGDTGRNSVSGPSEFVMNAGVGRSFLFGERSSIDWRIDATNLLNTVNYSGVDTTLGSPRFGLPTRAGAMRRILASARVRF